MEEGAKEKKSMEFKDIVRLIDKDVKGKTSIWIALTKVKGVGFMLSNAICNVLNLDKQTQVGSMTSEQLKKIEECARNPQKYGILPWLLNRQRDIDTGEDKHLVSADLKLRKEFDIRYLKKIKCYRGIRHARGSKKVRGQKTRSTGRRGKTIGVKRKKKGSKKG